MQRFVEATVLLPLLLGGLIEVARRNVAQVARQPIPGLAVGDEPISVPDMVGQRAVFLHFIELGGLDRHQRGFLAIYDLGLER